MAKIGNDSTDFAGLEVRLSRPGTYIKREDMGGSSVTDGILTDQAALYQHATGMQLDFTTPTALTSADYHIHDGTDGAVLGWPLSHYQRTQTESYSTSTVTGCGFSISLIAAATTHDRVLLRWPVYIPTGNDVCWLVINGTDEFFALNPEVKLLNTSFVEQTSFTGFSSAGYTPEYGTARRCKLDMPSTGAVYIISIECYVDTDTEINSAVVYNIDVMPKYYAKNDSNKTPPQAPYEFSSDDQPSTGGNMYLGIEEEFLKADRPLTSYVVFRSAANDAMLHKLITGANPSGEIATSNYGHDHRYREGAAYFYGSYLENVPLAGKLAGCVTYGDDANYDSYGGGKAPYTQSSYNGYSEAGVLALHNPKYYGGSITATWYAVTHGRYANAARDVRVQTSSDFSSWSATSADSSASAAGWHYHSGSVTLTADSLEYLRFEHRYNYTETGIKSFITGFGVYIP